MKNKMKEKIKKVDLDNIKLSDEELCVKAQNDLYNYRKDMLWVCPKCNYKISYLETLELETKIGTEHGGVLWQYNCPSTYINETNKNKIEVCNQKMISIHNNKNEFSSIYYNILYNRYKKIIEVSANKSRNLDDEVEIIGILTDVFDNSVFSFCRDKFGNILDFGSLCFKSYLYTRFKGRLRELQYFHNRGKRSPGIACKCCGKIIGAITIAHLLEDFNQYKADYCPNKMCVYSQKYIKKFGKKGICNIEAPEGRICHAKLHEKIIDNVIGKDNFNNLFLQRDKKLYTNGYNFLQKQEMSNIIIEEYKKQFPQALLNNNIISLHIEIPSKNEENKNTLLDITSIENGYYSEELDTYFKDYKEYIWFNDLISKSIDLLFYENNIENNDLKRNLKIMYHLLIKLYDSSLEEKSKKKNISLYYEEVCDRLMIPLSFVKEWSDKFLNNQSVLDMIKNEINILERRK